LYNAVKLNKARKLSADLFIIKIHKDYCTFDGTLKSVRRGYFQDVYNDCSLFSFIRSNTDYVDLSWRNLRDEKWFNRRKNMTLEGAKEFLKLMQDASEQVYSRDKFQLLCNRFSERGCIDEMTTPLNCFDVLEYKEWLECLIAFLELALKKKSTIKWSV
jgi:hypothetical protein